MTRNCESCSGGCHRAKCVEFSIWTPSLEAYEKLEQDFEKLRKCVEFYADYVNWDGIVSEKENRVLIDDCSSVTISRTPIFIRGIYGGKLARQTLAEIEV